MDMWVDSHLKTNTILIAVDEPIINLYVIFLTPVVSEFKKVSSFFQSDTIDAKELMKRIQMHSDSLRNRIHNQQAVSLCNFGAHFLSDMQKLMLKSTTLGR